MSWGFQPRQVGTEWNPATRDLPRGAWPVCGEADHGLVAGIEAACTVLFEDPLFGLMAFGGEVARTKDLIASSRATVSGSDSMPCLESEGCT